MRKWKFEVEIEFDDDIKTAGQAQHVCAIIERTLTEFYGDAACDVTAGEEYSGVPVSIVALQPLQLDGPPLTDPSRCQVCDWPLAESADNGCVTGNCSYRPEQGSPEWHRIERRRAALAMAGAT